MQYFIEQNGTELIVRLEGEMQPGSEQNDFVAAVVKDLHATLRTSDAAEFVLDCRELNYTWGDAIGSIWLTALKRKLRCRIRATGVTRERLSELVKLSIPIPISE